MLKKPAVFRWALRSCLAFSCYGNTLNAADPTAKDALELKPVQAEVPFERPSKEQLEKCTIHKLNGEHQAGWVIRDPSGQTLRRFADTNKDGKLDQWCYFREGVEVYRDIDANFNGKADQYRWLGTSGIRWGLDDNEDGRIDGWKMISPEEVTAEVIAALRDKDAERFARLLITAAELKSLGLDEPRAQEISQKLSGADAGFKALAARQKVVGPKTEWTNFGATQPGVLPAGTDGTQKDVIVYENVAAMVENGGKTAQVPIGTLVQVGATWRLIDLPTADAATTAGHHFFIPIPGRTEGVASGDAAISPEMQKLVAQLEEIDVKLSKATAGGTDLARLHTAKAAITEKLYAASTSDEDRQNWVRQLADSVSASIQTGEFPDGLQQLKSLAEKLESDKASRDLQAYVQFRYLSANYSLAVQDPKADVAKVQSDWVENLESFVTKFPDSSDTPEAMFQLAIGHEFAGKTEAAAQWYGDVARKFAGADVAKKAAGAKTRLESVGKTVAIRGRSLDGKPIDVADFRGAVVVVHYWATWCGPCKQDMQSLKQLQAKYGRRLALLGVNLDVDAKTAAAFTQTAKLTWPQLYEPGGLDSRLANELGVFTLPTMLLLDPTGKVANRNIHAAELESELARLFKEPAGGAARAALPTAKGR